MFFKQLILLSATLFSTGSVPALSSFDLLEDKVASIASVQKNSTIEELRQEIENKFTDSTVELELFDQLIPRMNAYYEKEGTEGSFQMILNAMAQSIHSSDHFAHNLHTVKVLWKEAKVSDPFILSSALIDQREVTKGFDLPFDEQLILLAEVLSSVRDSELTQEEMRVVLEMIDAVEGNASEVMTHALREEIGYKMQ